MLDVTLAAEGRFIKAHKVILAASSKYFEVGFLDAITSLELGYESNGERII